MRDTFQWPPELLMLMIETIPLLFKSKRDVLLFFRGAGVDSFSMTDLEARVKQDRAGISKYEIVRVMLTRLNEKGDATLRERREILKRVVEFEDFSTCWEEDRLKAQGLVSQIRRVVDVKDSFVRMNTERESERLQRIAEQRSRLAELGRQRTLLEEVKNDLFALFRTQDRQKRGKALEGVLIRLFDVHGILVSEAFTLASESGEGVIEQIDGVIELEGQPYLVEMKWHEQPLGPAELAQGIVRVYGRGGQAHGIFISHSGYTPAAIITSRDALQGGAVIVLCELGEVVDLLERERDMKIFLKNKIRAAIVPKNPMYKMST